MTTPSSVRRDAAAPPARPPPGASRDRAPAPGVVRARPHPAALPGEPPPGRAAQPDDGAERLRRPDRRRRLLDALVRGALLPADRAAHGRGHDSRPDPRVLRALAGGRRPGVTHRVGPGDGAADAGLRALLR